MSAQFRSLVFGLAAVSVALSGCQDGGPRGPTAKVEGNVTVEGVAVESGDVQFVPQAGQGDVVVVKIQAGRYAAPAVPHGKHLVLLNAVRQTGRMIKDYSEPHPEVVSIIPERYRPGIPVEVTGNNPALNFELKSR